MTCPRIFSAAPAEALGPGSEHRGARAEGIARQAEVNATALAMVTPGCLLAAQVILFRIARRTRTRGSPGAVQRKAR